ncbi:hypothetical protein CsSME_00010427 [Camellia sinensis var. sinensis]
MAAKFNFFSETKQLFKQLDFLGMSLGYRNCVGVDCNGSRDGLWATWETSPVSLSRRYADVQDR